MRTPSWEATARHVADMEPDAFFETWSRVSITSPRTADDLLRMRFRHDRAGMLRYCFPAYFPDTFNAFHDAVLNRQWPSWKEREDAGEVIREADAAPRGFGKTTLTKGEIAWAAANDIERSVVVISNEQSLAIEITADLRSIFMEPTPEFERLYGPFKVVGGVEKFSVGFPDGHTTHFRAKSMGSQLRGLSRGGIRPTLVLLDDAERSDRVRSPKQRRQWWEVLHADILKLGKAKGGLYCRVRGTVLHPDSGLATLLKPETPGWRATRWRACVNWDEMTGDSRWMALWTECGAIYKDLTLGDEEVRTACARAFFEQHQDEMEGNVSMLDPDWLGIFKFWKRIWDEGLKSVLQEMQNDPRGAGEKFFDVRTIARCKVEGTPATGGVIIAADGRRVKMADCRFYARLDPIPGKELGTMGDDQVSGGGDYAAIVILARDPFGFGFVVDAWLKRARDSEQLMALWALCEKWGVSKATIEANGFQRLLGRDFRRQQEERREDGRFWQVAAEADVSTENKFDRIASLEAPFAATWLQIADSVSELLMSQLDAFPDGDHDDGPDAVEGAWRLSNTVRVGMVNLTAPKPPTVRPTRGGGAMQRAA